MNDKTDQGPTPHSTLSIVTQSEDQTRQLGAHIGRRLNEETLILLNGELGCGKTCFVQGLAQGLKVPDEYPITSPTYTLINEYQGRLPLIHIDLYRIHNEDDAENIGLFDIWGAEAIVAVEWAARINDDFWPRIPTLNIALENPEAEVRHLRLFGYGLQITDLIKEIGTLWNTPLTGTLETHSGGS